MRAAERGLYGHARRGIEVASHGGRRAVVTNLIQRLRLRGGQVSPGWGGRR